jgi:hypothetical protein
MVWGFLLLLLWFLFFFLAPAAGPGWAFIESVYAGCFGTAWITDSVSISSTLRSVTEPDYVKHTPN